MIDIPAANGAVPENIARIIAEKRLKKSAVAEKCGMTAQQITDVLGGRRLLKVSDVTALAKALGVRPAALLMERS